MAQDYVTIEELVALIGSVEPIREDLINEIIVIQSIYDDALSVYTPPPTTRYTETTPALSYGPDSTIRLTLTIELEDDVKLSLIISIPFDYPATSSPIIQLRSIYISDYSVDDVLFSDVLRTFMHSKGTIEVEFKEGEVCIYEGIERVKARCQSYVIEKDKLEAEKQVLVVRDEMNSIDKMLIQRLQLEDEQEAEAIRTSAAIAHDECSIPCLTIISSEPVIDRKSTFIGHCSAVSSMAEVQSVIDKLLSDKRISKASHNISAYKFHSNGLTFQDNNDDGESAAGSRLAHLLDLLEVDGVVVVVSRWFGGIQLGADRFKHINQAARDSLKLGGFLDEKEKKKGSKKHHHR